MHALLERWGIQVAYDSVLALHDTADNEPEVESVSDADEALRRIVEWPTLGTLDYGGPEGIVTVSYLGGPAPNGLQVVMISAQERSVDRTDSVSRYQRLGAALHDELRALGGRSCSGDSRCTASAGRTRSNGYAAEESRGRIRCWICAVADGPRRVRFPVYIRLYRANLRTFDVGAAQLSMRSLDGAYSKSRM